MPYETLGQLPKQVADNLPKHAQEIYKEAYNAAYQQYADPKDRDGDSSREETAHKVAWSAVKSSYEKDAKGNWKHE